MSLDGSLAEALSATSGPPPDPRPATRLGDRRPDPGLITLDQLEVASYAQKCSGVMLGDGCADLRDAAESASVAGPVGSRRTAPAA